MKKALVVLLILAIAGGLFAQGLEWSGAVKTGMKFLADDEHNGKDITVDMYSDDAEVPIRLQLGGTYTQENYGAKFGARFDPAALTAFGGGVSAKLWGYTYNAYVWAEFVNDIVKVSAGRIDDGVWGTGGPEDYTIKGDGLRVEVAPITGLNLGLMLRAPVMSLTIKDFLSETAFGAKYEGGELFWIAGGLILDSQADGLQDAFDSNGITSPTVDAPNTDSDHGLVFQAGAGVKPGILGLEVKVEAKANNASKFSDYGYFVLDEDVSIKPLDKLTVGLKAYQTFFGSDWGEGIANGEDLKPLLKFTPYVGYALLDNVKLDLEATIGLWKDVYDLDFTLKPKVTYTLGEKAKIVAFYKFNSLDFYEDVEIADRKSNKSNTVQIDFIWEF
jgi:hypothetical protein